MIRAGIFIGVDKSGGLRKLQDAASGARSMYEWAIAQGMADGSHAKLITDADGGNVGARDIYRAVKTVVDGAGVDQLLIYFAGHGVFTNRCEQWLLSDAPEMPNEAVNVTGSVDLARYSGVPHVVIVSDACRIAPEGIQAQYVMGQEIFSNDPPGDSARPVDQFFACGRGRTAAELLQPDKAAEGFRALYTGAMLDALKGAKPEVLEPSGDPSDTRMYVRPLKLQEYLKNEVPRRVISMNLQHKVNQNPDAILIAHDSWLSRVDRPPRVVRRPAPPAPVPPPDVRSVAARLVHTAVSGNTASLAGEAGAAAADGITGADSLARGIAEVAAPFGPDSFETECGVKVRGARILRAVMLDTQTEMLGSELVRIHQMQTPSASILLQFESGAGTVIPALHGYLAVLTFEDGELVDVGYEPAATNWRWDEYRSRAEELRTLRAVAAASTRHGRFRLDGEDAEALAGRMQLAKGVDPSLAVYAAWAFYDLQDIERIRRMSEYLREDVGATLFDLELLARRLRMKSVDRSAGVVPFVPLLSQSWSLIRANRVNLYPGLNDLGNMLRESVWSLYEPEGVRRLERALMSGEVR